MSGDLDLPARPYPKSTQLVRGQRRYHRKVASARRWQQIIDAKGSVCRSCNAPPPNQLHHLIPRAQGGSDTESNIIPLCQECHGLVTRNDADTIRAMLASLSDDEYAYAIEHGGESFFERSYGLKYDRAAAQ